MKVVELLVKNGADINIKSNTGWTALMFGKFYLQIKKKRDNLIFLF